MKPNCTGYWKISLISFLALPLLLLTADGVMAQFSPEGDIHVVTRADGRAYIYHGEEIPLSHGYNVYRKTGESEWEPLTDEPIFPAISGFDFERRVGESYPFISELLESDNPQSVFLRLRSNTQTGLLASFIVPEVAQAVGRLYIDEDSPVGQSASYRFEIVDDLERPTGQFIEGSADLNPLYPPAPSDLEIEHEGKRVTARWSYVPTSNMNSRNVIRFQIFYEMEGSDPIKAHSSFIARTDQQTEYLYSFDVPELENEYTFSIYAIDFTGQLSESSDRVAVDITNNIAPERIANVRAESTEDYEAYVTWPVSTNIRLEGYQVYRARNDEEVYQLMNQILLEPLQTVYVDSTVEPGNQYRYSITAIDSLGNESARSNPAHVLITDYRVPDPVTYLDTQIMEDRTILLTWNNSEVPAGLRNYLLLRRQTQPDAGRSFIQVNSERLADTLFVDRGIGNQLFTEGATYEYGITVVSNNGSYSDTVYTEISIPDLTPPEPPTLMRLSMEEGQRVQVTWNASANTDVTEYALYRNQVESGPDTLLSLLPKGTRFYRDELIEMGQMYTYSISAIDSVGNESEFISDSIAARLTHPPAPVRNVQVAYIQNSVTISWENSESSEVVGYNVYKAETATGIYELVGRSMGNENEYIDTSGAAGVWYKVFPTDASGREARSARATQAVEVISRSD